jgi:hypothetical protein
MGIDLAAIRAAAAELTRAISDPEDCAIRHVAARLKEEEDKLTTVVDPKGYRPLGPEELDAATVLQIYGRQLLGLLDLDGAEVAQKLPRSDREALHRVRALLSDSWGWGSFCASPDRRRDLLLALEAVRDFDPAAPDQCHYVDLDQAAAAVHRSKSSLEKRKRRKNNPLPDPDVPGGGGKKDFWLWSRLRPWLEAEFSMRLTEVCPRRL